MQLPYYQDHDGPSQAYVTLAEFAYPVKALWFYFSQRLFNYLAFQSFDFECT